MNHERGSVSVVVAAIVLIALVMSVGLADMARVLVARSHARTAADAAALAVAQELVLPLGSEPAQIAAQYAEWNGAVLTDCVCAVGALEDTVTVVITVEGFLLITGARTVTARARAVVDVPATPDPSLVDRAGRAIGNPDRSARSGTRSRPRGSWNGDRTTTAPPRRRPRSRSAAAPPGHRAP